MKKLWLCAFSLIAVMMLFTGCDKSNNPMVNINDDPDVSLTTPPPGAQSAVIKAAQTIPVGNVYIWFTATGVRVLYKTDSPYLLTEYHVQIGVNLDAIPQSNGNPVPGQFDFKDEIAPTNEVYFEIPWSAIPGGQTATTLIVAAHCVVVKEGDPTWQQTGWAGNEPFPGHNWAKYFTVNNLKLLSLPTGHVYSQFNKITNDPVLGGGIPATFHIWNLPPGNYDITAGYYNSWCLDHGIYIYGNEYHETHLWLSTDPGMPVYCKYNRDGVTLTPYDKINYLLNKYLPAYTGQTLPIGIDDALIRQLQHCFWYYRGDMTLGQLSTEEQGMISDANTNGVNFCPHVGQWIAVIIDNGSSVQICFLLIDP